MWKTSGVFRAPDRRVVDDESAYRTGFRRRLGRSAGLVTIATVSMNYLVTGANGCIGAWVAKTLIERGDRPVIFDLTADKARLSQILPEEVCNDVAVECGDLADFDAVQRALQNSSADRIIHLAGLQVPFCKADPIAGARVNVLGTVHVFEAALRAGIERVAYASSAAVYGPEAGRVDESVVCVPTTHYGVYKCANEGSARESTSRTAG